MGGLLAGIGAQGAPVNWASGAILGIDATNANGGFTYAGDINDSGNGPRGLATLGGAVILTAPNSYSGPTTITGSTLQLGTGADGQDGSIAGTSGVTDNAALVFNLAGTQTASYAISGSGSLSMVGSGNLFLSGSNTYTGGTFVTGAGVLTVTSPSAIEDGTNLYVGTTSGLASLGYPASIVPSGASAAPASVPEPGTLALLAALGTASASLLARRNRRGCPCDSSLSAYVRSRGQ
jgi:autotransporter-associated beta strand protein